MKSDWEKFIVWFVIISSIFHFETAQAQTTVSEASFTYDGTEFELFYTSPNINQENAQTECMAWGGNLATIKSAVEDSLLLYSSPDLDTIFTCHIGLNRIGGTEFVWIDGTSSYRNWGTLFMVYPRAGDFDCVRNRYRAGVLSQGWLNDLCTTTRNCYFCSKPGTSNGCELTYNTSCYKVFEVSTPINWLDAQSSCAIWGGDLTSITTERENNYLNTLITSNCWIGLNDRDVEGTYTWIDGTTVSYTNWTVTPPNVTNSDCVQINNAGDGMWDPVSCDITLNVILCKRDSSSTIPTVGRFGRITDGAYGFEALTGNTFFYEPLTLVCGSIPVVWRYSQHSSLSGVSLLPETSNHVDFSWLDVDTTKQGYYRCTTSNTISHTVGIYDKTLTTVAVTGTSYTYIVGVDITDVLLLCDPEDGGSLSTLRWSVQNGMEFLNPINLNSESSNLPDVSTSFSCKRGGDTLNTAQICVKVPTISISYGVVPVTSYSSVYPEVNPLSVPSAVQDITLSINIEGKWTLPNNTNSSNSVLAIPTFSSQENGVYKFYINNWDGVEVCAIQVTLTTTTNIVGVPDTQLTYENTEFGYFSDSPLINWYTAQLGCLDWGGNLATIKSEEEDSLLFYSTDIQTHYKCYIGLNDILSEAGTDGSAYTWVDGSSSAYRNFLPGFPLTGVERDCVIFRFIIGGVLSEGWVDPNCNNLYNCHFCTKSATSGDCDLIYDGSCYKVFEVSISINWLDAQSSCAIWGGDLTNITTERENNYLNTLITSSVGNCWIGLNDRGVEGTYTWIDGTTYTQQSFLSIQSNSESNDCVEFNTTGSSWVSVDCNTTSGKFMCERESNVTSESIYVVLTNGAVLYQPLISDRFLYNPTLTLVYGIGDFGGLVWKYSTNSELSDSTTLSATFSDLELRFTSLTIDNSMQGYYYYELSSVASSIVGLYDDSITTVAAEGTTYTYISGVDRQDVLLLCAPNDGGSLNLKWDSTLANPVNIYSERSQFQSEPAAFICTRDTATIVTTHVSVIVPEISVKYYQFLSSTHTDTSSTNTATIPLSTQQVSLSTNLGGHWNIPGDMNTSSSTANIGTFVQANAGLYTLYTNNWVGVEVIAMQINIVSSPALTVMTPEQEFIFDDTRFGYFSDNPDTDWLNAQLNCNSWGGSLATIKSEKEDNLLLYTTTDTRFACYIGLNDILNEANGNGGDYTWVDGSSSAYRNFEPLFPSSNVDRDCVRFRYKMESQDLSQGWVNEVCSSSYNCHFCTNTATSGDCDLTYDGSCYKVFTVSTLINWLDAQSSCAIWGGDLTSITTERENNYLNTLITSSVGNCWIGLNDRDVEGTYTWIDGTTVSYTNWTSTPSDVANSNCCRINNIGNGIWESVSCDTILNTFLCKRDSSNDIPIVGRFGRITDGAYKFEELTGNTFFYEPLTLVCGSNGSPVVWSYLQNSDLSGASVLPETYNYVDFSWLDVNKTKQGYYRCTMSNAISYTVGVYDTTLTTVAVTGTSYTYIVGVDRTDVLLLCDPEDGGSLSMLRWSLENGMEFFNPINLNSESSNLPNVSTALSCNRGGVTLNTTQILVKVPILTVSTTESSVQFSALYPANNTISLKVRTEDFSLSVNLPGRWRLPNNTFIDEQSISYQTLDYQYFGLYQYLINNWDGNEVVATQITLIPDGFVVTDPISLSNAPIQNDSIVFASQNTSMIHCAVSSLSDNVQWTFSSQNNGMITNITSLATFSEETGFSTLVVTSNEPGYYSCIINTLSVYTFSVFDENSIVQIDSLDDPLQQVNFTVDSPVSLLYYPSSAIRQNSVSHRDIHWTTDTVIDGEEKSYSSEYSNPADLNTVFSTVGGGVHTFSCFYRMSPVTLLGSLQLVLKDTATITVYYEGYSKIFSDVNNPIFPSAQEITILTGTKYIVLTCNLPDCAWMISDESDFITVDSYIIPEISDSYSRTFSLMRMTSNGASYSTAHVHIHAQVVTQSPTSTISPLVAVVVIVLVLILILGTIAILIPLCIYFYKKKRNVFKRPKPSYPPKRGNFGYEYLSELHLPSMEYINLQVNPNSECMAICETSMMELENEQMHKGYTNLTYESAYTSTYEQINERTMKTDTELNPDIPYEGYVPMTCVEKEKRFVSRSIPTKEFPVAYQQYVSSGIGKDSLFSIEYTNLNEDTQINVELETNEALKVENTLRNPMKNIIPFDENRVVLQSTYFNCDYINASYISDYQFIATIHPTRETHRDFLQMIYQTEASMVIMLTTRKEKAKIISGISNRVCYWPKKDEPIECTPFLTTLINSTETAAFIKQEISVKNTLESKGHTFIHCISPLWNEDSTVSEMTPTLALLSRILKQIQDMPSKPIIIHCEDGISKTGILLTGVNSVNELTHKKSINIFNSVKNLRRQRMKMVPTVACYTTCYSLMNEYCSIHL